MSNIEEIVSNIDKIEPDAMLELDKILCKIEIDEYRDYLIEIEEGLLEDHPEDFEHLKTEEDKRKHIETSVDASLSSWKQKNNPTPIEKIIYSEMHCSKYTDDGDYIIDELEINNAIQALISQILNCDKKEIISRLKKQNVDVEKLIDSCKQYLKK